ncbi:MAG: hypothetical protein ABR565_00950 [Gammaproteobacteria bacterium]
METPGTVAYLPHALRWATDASVVLPALFLGTILGLFGPSWLGVFFIALFGSAALTWLLTVQQRAIFGYGDAPTLAVDDLQFLRGNGRALVEAGSMIAAGYGALYLTAPELARWFAWGAGALLPALFARASVEESLWPALNPRRIGRVLLAGGPVGWLLAVGAAIGMEHVARAAADFVAQLDAAGLAGLIDGWAPSATAIAAGVGGLWLAALCVHLHGHALHHARERAELPVVLAAADEDECAATKCSAAVRRAADRIEAARARNDAVGVDQWCAMDAPEGVGEVAYRHELWELLLERKLNGAAVRVARRLVAAAAREKRYALAVSVLGQARRLSPSFKLAPAVRLQLARAARASNDDAQFDILTAPDTGAPSDDDPAVAELAAMRADWLAARGKG